MPFRKLDYVSIAKAWELRKYKSYNKIRDKGSFLPFFPVESVQKRSASVVPESFDFRYSCEIGQEERLKNVGEIKMSGRGVSQRHDANVDKEHEVQNQLPQRCTHIQILNTKLNGIGLFYRKSHSLKKTRVRELKTSWDYWFPNL